ncbi:MAG: Na+/H+ antiporter NhaA [Calditrichia bacterium]
MKNSLLIRPFREFFQMESSGGILLLASTIIALIWANSGWQEFYQSILQLRFTIGFETFALSKPLILWINDGLMAIFFFLVGLEIKREVLTGELASLRKAILPMAAALGGMILPAGIYMILNAGSPGFPGWGIPMATDIAFALGILALLGSRAPVSLKVFLTALAIVDDLGAVLVIAFFYTSEIAWGALAAGGVFLMLLILSNRLGIRKSFIYVLLGAGMWVAFLKSGVHATIAGVLLAMTIPSQSPDDSDESLLERMEHALNPWVAYGIIPVFALANAGVMLGGNSASAIGHPVTLGIIAGLILGKQIGITFFSWVSVRSGLADLPEGVSWGQIYGAASLAGIGFTMSLFIANLGFGEGAFLFYSKVGILLASLISAIWGLGILGLLTSSAKEAQMGGEELRISAAKNEVN